MLGTAEVTTPKISNFVDSKFLLLSTDGFAFASTARAVRLEISSGSIPAKDVSKIV